MMRYLLFTLAAPMASFGTVAVGERRPTWDRPSKSQTIGLVAGSLGIERSNEVEQGKLAAGLGFAVRIEHPGRLASDYHTAEAAKDVAIRRWSKKNGPLRTRADELDCDDRKTILSQREFRTDSFYTICLWRHDNAECASLDRIASALREPTFAPFAGRKAHALMLPMDPHLIEADRPEWAFSLFDAKSNAMAAAMIGDQRRPSQRLDPSRPIFADAAAVLSDEREVRVAQVVERRDVPESRAKWRFGLRAEVLLKTAPTEGDVS